MISKGNLPTAIFAASDHIAIGAMRALQENGYKIPEDISVMGFDNTELSGYTNPPLTTVNAPVYAMGIYGIRFILNLMKPKSTDYYSPMRVYLPCPIKVRNSCTKPKSFIIIIVIIRLYAIINYNYNSTNDRLSRRIIIPLMNYNN